MKIHLPQAQSAPNGKLGFDYTIDLSAEVVHFIRPFQSPVRICGCVTDSAGMIRLDGTIEARVSARCARCDRPVDYDKRVDVSFMLATALEDEDVDDIWVVEGDELELDEVFVPELIMDMEMSVLCNPDCPGRCTQCGHDLNEGECGCDRRVRDPRMAVFGLFPLSEPDPDEEESF